MLEARLLATGIISEEKCSDTLHVDHKSLGRRVDDHCVVMTGHLPAEYWPKYRRRTSEPRAVTLCTCGEFSAHAECEHQLFVLAQEDGPGAPRLSDAPTKKKLGRKCKEA